MEGLIHRVVWVGLKKSSESNYPVLQTQSV